MLELIVVMTILVLLAGTVTYYVMGRTSEAKSKRARLDIENLKIALDMYKADNHDYPSNEQGLEALIRRPTTPPEPPNWTGKYLDRRVLPKDPWARQYIYKYPGERNEDGFDLWTYGRDGQEGGTREDADVNNWDEE